MLDNLAHDEAISSRISARLAQSAERKARNLVVVGSSSTVGVSSSQACQSPTYVTFEVEVP